MHRDARGQSIILQPGPAALTDGLDALHTIIARWTVTEPAH
jgi:iron complex transport system substrate-binding protein